MMIQTEHDGYINSDYIEWIDVELVVNEEEADDKLRELAEMINNERRGARCSYEPRMTDM